jgi:tetratricopeptide (TPR) repeat protein
MQSRIADLPVSRNYRVSIRSFLLTAVIFCVAFFSPTASRPLSASTIMSDSLAEASKREFVGASLENVKGEYHKAAERYRKLLTLQPSNAAIHYALSKAWAGLGVLDSARMYSEKCVLLNPDNKYYTGFLAALCHQMHDYRRAADLYRNLSLAEPGNMELLSNLALEYLALDQSEKALAVFQEILALDPKSETTLAQMLLMEIKLSHFHDAIATLTELIRQSDGQEKLRLTLGELYLQTRQYDLASQTFRALLLENPRDVPVWLALFEVSVQSGNHPVFLEDLNRFFTTNQLSLEQKIELARLFLMRSISDSSFVAPALVMIGEINKRHPENAKVYVLHGMAQLQKSDVDAAVLDFRKALSLEPGAVDIWEELVTAYLIKKEYQQAGEMLSKAKKRLPRMTLRLQMLEGEIFFQKGQFRKSALLLEKVMKSMNAQKEKRLYQQACTTLASCYDALGFRRKSARLYEIILTLDPENVLMMNNLAFVLATEGIELPRARAMAVKALAAEPSNAGYLDTFGWVLFRLGEYEKARKTLEKAAALDPLQVEILEHLTSVYEKLGNQEKMLEMKEKIRMLKVK